MTRGVVLAITCCLSLHAQFGEMVTTDDGGTLLFNSAWRLAGSNDTARPKVFRWDAKGFSLVYSPPDPGFVNPSYVFGAFLSGDGKIWGYVTYPGCSGAACSSLNYTLVLNGATAPPSLTAFPPFQVSRNGRFLSAGPTVVDLSNGVARTAPGGLAWGGSAGIGNNGGLLMLTLHSAFILSTVDLTLSTKPDVVIASAQHFDAAVVSALENRVVYEAGGRLWSYDVATAQATKLAELDGPASGPSISQFQPSISNDGARLLYRRFRSDANVWEAVVQDLNNAVATVIAQILPDSLAISGDGKSAWVHRLDGRLVRIAIDGLQTFEVPGRHLWAAEQDGGQVYGSLHHLYGGGFAPDEASGAPQSLSVDLAGIPFPIVAAGTQKLDVQISWNAPAAGQFPMTVRNSESPFESVLMLDLEGAAPTFERTGLPDDQIRMLKVYHQDFRGLVTQADPALPGEYLHAYMTGLGDVQPRPLTGSPPSGLSYSLRPLCWLSVPLGVQEFAQVSFAGLAPGMIGLYQVDLQIPADFPQAGASLSCVAQAGSGLSGDAGTIFVGKH